MVPLFIPTWWIQLVAKCISYFPFTILAKLLGYTVQVAATSSLTFAKQTDYINQIRKRYPKVEPDYIYKRFKTYPYCFLISKKNKIKGCMFYNCIEETDAFHIYIGPLFFLQRLALCFSFTFIEHYLKTSSKRLYLLGEVQNPELIIHFHMVLPAGSVIPTPVTFDTTPEATAKLNYFVEHVPQLDSIDTVKWRSTGNSSTFFRKGNPTQALLLQKLLERGVDLVKGDSLVMLMTLQKQDTQLIRKKIWQAFLAYPLHRTKYLEAIQSRT